MLKKGIIITPLHLGLSKVPLKKQRFSNSSERSVLNFKISSNLKFVKSRNKPLTKRLEKVGACPALITT